MKFSISPIVKASSRKFSDAGFLETHRGVPEETPVSLTYGRVAHAVMLATPSDLEDFAIGFSLNEEIIRSADEIESLEVIAGEIGVELRMDLAAANAALYSRRRRVLMGPTGCGLCGIESLTELARALPAVESDITLSPAQVAAAVDLLALGQKHNRETRALHAAGFWMAEQGMIAVREDVGRHNALDKVSGALARRKIRGRDGVVVITSRVSLEIVQKTARLGSSIIIAVSAPTALAIRSAEASGITLVAIARGTEFEIFTHPHRIASKVRQDVG